MAQGYKRRHPGFGQITKLRSGRHQARYKTGSKYRTGPNTWIERDDAARWLDETFDSIQRHEWSPHGGGLESFQSWGERWRKLHKADGKPRSYKTLVDYESTLRLHAYDFLGDIPVEDIDTDTIGRFQHHLQTKLEDGCGNKRCTSQPCRTRQKAEKYTSAVLRFAVRKGALRLNPYDDEEVFMPGVDNRREAVPFEESDIELLCSQFHPHYRTAIMVDAYMGLRSGELWALRRRSVNVLRKELAVTHSVGEVTGQGLVMGPPKNRKPRTLAIPATILELIEQHMERVPGGPDDWLFPNQHGNQNRHSTFTECFFGVAIKRAELPERSIFHDLRHFCARFHISQGYEPYDIMSLLGHSSITVTMDIYGGLFDRRRREMADQVDQVLKTRSMAMQASKVSSLVSPGGRG
jgi:integrase